MLSFLCHSQGSKTSVVGCYTEHRPLCSEQKAHWAINVAVITAPGSLQLWKIPSREMQPAMLNHDAHAMLLPQAGTDMGGGG